MDSKAPVPLAEGIKSLANITRDLRSDILRFGVVAAIEIILVLAVGGVYQGDWRILVFAFSICLLTNVYIIHKASALMKFAEQQRHVAQDRTELRADIQRDFEKEARMAFDSFAISAQGLIDPIEAGVLVAGWKENLSVRKIVGIWQGLAEVLGTSLHAKYQDEGPTE
jgi:hypothetical protein